MAIRLDQLGARSAIHDAYSIQLRSKGFDAFEPRIGGTGFDSDYAICDGVMAGRVMALVDALPDLLRHWLVWMYCPAVKATNLLQSHGIRLSVSEHAAQGKVFSWLNDEVGIRLLESDKKYRSATLTKIRDVVAWTVLDYRESICTDKHPYPVSEIKKLCGIAHNNWRRDFACWHQVALDICDALDREALRPVGKMLGLYRDGEVERVNGKDSRRCDLYIQELAAQKANSPFAI